MRIVFWNIRAGGGIRVGRIAAQLQRWAPDTVALCEFRATPPSLELARSLAALGLASQCTTAEPSQPSANRLLIATRFPMRRLRLRLGSGDPARLLLLASIDAPEPLTLGAMHVPNRVTGRKDLFYAAILTLLARWRRGPTMLLGDTNTGRPGLDEETPVFGPREDAWLSGLEQSGWLDAFRLLRRTARVYTWYSPNGGNGFRLDQAFVNDRLRPRLRDVRYDWGRRVGRSGRRLSDHAALLVDLHS
jgi:exonuclease III